MSALTIALAWAATLAECERNPAEVDRLASELIEVSTRHHCGHWLLVGAIYRGWARSAAGKTVEGTAWIEQGVRLGKPTEQVEHPATVSRLTRSFHLLIEFLARTRALSHCFAD
jgi:hypothetical protein